MIRSLFSFFLSIPKVLPKHGGAVAGIGFSMLLGQCTGLQSSVLGMQGNKLSKNSPISAPKPGNLKTLAMEEAESKIQELNIWMKAADGVGNPHGVYKILRGAVGWRKVFKEGLLHYAAKTTPEEFKFSFIYCTISYRLPHCLDYILDEEVKALREFVPFFIENEARKYNLPLYYGLRPLIQAYVGLPTYIKQYLMERLKEMGWSREDCDKYERF